MSKEIEKLNLYFRPIEVNGLDEQKIAITLQALLEKATQTDANVEIFTVAVKFYFSTREINMMAHRLKPHALRVLWLFTSAQTSWRNSYYS